jgi:hypothetical protein
VPFWVWTRYTGTVAQAHPSWGDLTYYVGAAAAIVVWLATRRLPSLWSLLGREAALPTLDAQDEREVNVIGS